MAAAPEMKGPRITTSEVDWDAARAEAADAFAPLNAAAGKLLANVAASGVPVLLPFDTAAFLRDLGRNGAATRPTPTNTLPIFTRRLFSFRVRQATTPRFASR